jgi:hypothetical protein
MATLALHWASVNDPAVMSASPLALALLVTAVALVAATMRLLRQVVALLAQVAQAVATAGLMILVTVGAIAVMILILTRL